MKRLMVLLFGVLLASSHALAQGTIGGVGGGGFGGGNFGSGVNDGSAALGGPGRSYINETQILTPGEFYEFPFEVSDGEGFRGEIRSSVFDPAVEIFNDRGQVIFEQDDPFPGKQNPKFFVRFPSAGTYRVRVKSFRSVAGGSFTINGQRVRCVTLESLAKLEPGQSLQEVFVEVPLQHNVYYSIHSTSSRGVSMGDSRTPSDDALSSSKDVVFAARFSNSKQPGPNPPQSVVFFSKAQQKVFVLLSAWFNEKLSLAVHPLTPIPMKTAIKTDRTKPAIFTSRVRPGDLVQVRAAGAKGSAIEWIWFEPDQVKSEPKLTDAVSPYGIHHSDPKDPALVRVEFNVAGTFFGVARHEASEPLDLTVSAEPFGKPWGVGDRIEGKLGMGDCHYYTLILEAGKQFELLAESEDFDIVLGTGGRGVMSETDDDGDSKNARMFAELTGAGPVLISVRSVGDGAKGTYRLSKRITEIPKLRLGVEESILIKQKQSTLVFVPCRENSPFYLEVEGLLGDMALSYNFRTPIKGGVQLIPIGPNKYGGIVNTKESTDLVLRFTTESSPRKVVVRTSKLPFDP